jgi:bacterioferritin-associated ferredoxin
MYLCICRAIREREVDAAVRAGARKPADVFRACGKSPQCGTCACDMRERIAHVVHDQAVRDRAVREESRQPVLMAAD